ncbi:4-aminobutyrate--2-oxoglutarate transaminase [Pseudodesulfovibrio cashew]|uniref:4-aminobutyrate--2-oxoglutarate transaminase n=1 Tax=Pseudodesulfovibrio cashew TaxID=2678688 RepID=A0A6I6JMR5_9BACT|nr:4-aminobutyrate--2-oxoglutarate transaminase [Pseudodesulfovibrio cashew]QGY41552.1 4-aminobutyrate--2-oxoglutarate transaminase [Pseudodesulfovibrio cashew]
MSQVKQDLLNRRAKAVAKGVSTGTVVAVKAEGAIITDVDGKEYIDFAGGIGVVNVGHNNPRVVEAIKKQADNILHTCFHVAMYEEYIALCEKLIEIAPGDFEKRAALFNSGAEAVENAIKIARHATGKQGVMVFENAFHGRTLLTMSLTSKIKPYKLGFGPYAPEIYRIPPAYCYRCPLGREYPTCDIGCADLLSKSFIGRAAAENLACVIAEPVMGEGGFIAPPKEYFPKIQNICRENDILFIADEVQSGFGRTGRMLAMEHWGVVPDLTVMAKSMGGGMPISAVAGRADIMDAPHVGGLGGTYGGNPVCASAALAAIAALEEDNLIQKGAELGDKLVNRFKELQERHAIIGEVRGKGPMLALELVLDPKTKEPAPAKAKELVSYCLDKGLILLSCGNFGNVIRTLMPLVITEEQLEKALSIMDEGLASISQ